MSKLLLTWEAGTHLGHEMQVTAAATTLRGAGHDVVIYAPAKSQANAAAHKAGVRWAHVPSLPPAFEQTPPPPPFDVEWHSRATALWGLGFHSAGIVRDRIDTWTAIFQHERPDAVVLQAAPFAQLAAHAAGLASVEFGIGFDVPPRQSPFPAFRNPESFDASQALALERAILDRIASAMEGRQTAMGAANGESPLHDRVSGQKRLVITLPELDHYVSHHDSSREFVGPLPLVDLASDQPRWLRGKPRVLAYVRADLLREPEQLIAAIGSLRGDAIVICFGADEATVKLAQALGIRLHLAPISIIGLLATADLVVSHGGGGLIAAAAIRGRPCVALPSNYEQFMTGMALMRSRLGAMANPMEPATYESALRHALTSPDVRRNTAALAARSRGKPVDSRTAFVAAVESLIKQG